MVDPLHVNPNADLTGQPDPIPYFQILPYINNNSPSKSDSFISDDSQKKEAAKNAEVNMVANAGLVDPDPFNVLASLFGLLGGLKFTEAIALVGAKIAIFSALARDYIQAAAKCGDKGAALRGREVLLQAPDLPNLLDDSDDVDLGVGVNYTDSDVEDALARADRTNTRRRAQARLNELNVMLPVVQDENQRIVLEDERQSLRNRSVGTV